MNRSAPLSSQRNRTPSRRVLPGVVESLPLAEIQAARSGDEAAFDSLVGPLIDPAFKLAVVLLRDRGEAEDAVQESCVKAWRNLGRLRDGGAMRPWFLSIVANQCRSMRRSRWWSVIRMDSAPAGDASSRDLEAGFDLGRQVAELPLTDRAALFLYFYLDMPMAEVAGVLGISRQAAKSRVHRAVERLRLSMVEVPE